MNEESDLFDKIKKVEAPPFLFTRIEQKIKATAAEHVRPAVAWTAMVSLFLILAVNFFAITGSKGKAPEQENLARGMNLYPQNSLYGL